MALTLADWFSDERTAYYAQQDKRDRIEVKIVSRAIEGARYQPRPIINAVAGAVLGLLLGVGLILLDHVGGKRTPAHTGFGGADDRPPRAGRDSGGGGRGGGRTGVAGGSKTRYDGH